MRWAEGFIAVDWGTTNRRAWRIDGGRAADEFEDGKGVLSVEKSDFPAAVAEIRERLGDLPLLMAGMIGSNRGWVETPYVHCPAGLDDVAASLSWAESDRTAIVPGLSCDPPDVMRGEEVQILGAIEAGLVPDDALVCHPGTHNKWVTLEGGKVARFRTVMTGEMFNLLRSHSILSDLLRPDVVTGPSFRAGVARGILPQPLTAELFHVRAGVLLGKMSSADAAAFVSGLLIGQDLSLSLADTAPGPLHVVGRPELTRLYAEGLAALGREAKEIDGETAFLAGINAIAGRL